MSLSNAYETSIINHVLGKSELSFNGSAVIDIALSTADPGEAGASLAEPTGNNYARKTTAPADWSVTGGVASNAAEQAFPEASGSWGTITHFAIFIDDIFAGSGALTAPKAIGAGVVFRFAAGQLTITLD